jgi:hypothetical protein
LKVRVPLVDFHLEDQSHVLVNICHLKTVLHTAIPKQQHAGICRSHLVVPSLKMTLSHTTLMVPHPLDFETRVPGDSLQTQFGDRDLVVIILRARVQVPLLAIFAPLLHLQGDL